MHNKRVRTFSCNMTHFPRRITHSPHHQCKTAWGWMRLWAPPLLAHCPLRASAGPVSLDRRLRMDQPSAHPGCAPAPPTAVSQHATLSSGPLSNQVSGQTAGRGGAARTSPPRGAMSGPYAGWHTGREPAARPHSPAGLQGCCTPHCTGTSRPPPPPSPPPLTGCLPESSSPHHLLPLQYAASPSVPGSSCPPWWLQVRGHACLWTGCGVSPDMSSDSWAAPASRGPSAHSDTVSERTQTGNITDCYFTELPLPVNECSDKQHLHSVGLLLLVQKRRCDCSETQQMLIVDTKQLSLTCHRESHVIKGKPQQI